MTHLEYFAEKFNLDLSQPSPIRIIKAVRPVMAQALADLGYTCGAEIGVARGDHSELLLQIIPNLTLYSIDAWPLGDRWPETWRDEAIKKLSPYPGCTIVEEFSERAALNFSDQSLDFVYIDAAHDFKNIAIDICTWRPKVRPGGILFGHDFIRHVNCQVLDVVPAYANAFDIKPWFVLGMGEASPAHPELGPMYLEFPPSWMYLL